MKFVLIIEIILVVLVCRINCNDPLATLKLIEADDDYEIDLSHIANEMYGLPDEEVGKVLENWDGTGNPEEQGSYLQGDILFPTSDGRNGLADKSKRWTNGIVPYEIKGNFNAFQMDIIEQALNAYHENTCIKFRPHMNERDYIVILSENTGCWSSVGKVGGRQEVNLQAPGCVTKVGTTIHELMHAIGFFHEQSRHERDNFVTINWKNIKSETKSNFDKVSQGVSNDFGVRYDYGSIMHYSPTAFSINGQPTIIPRKSKIESAKMGQRIAFSNADIQKIRHMYCTN